ncbi:MAG: transposase [Chloroflexi bacterium]|nr:transposase [Chloroflexota bacterium]
MNKPNRQSIRLLEYDYSRGGAYFVTICVAGMHNKLGEVVKGDMKLNELGTIATNTWPDVHEKYPVIYTDIFCIMPNHTHAIISILNAGRGGVPPPSPIKGEGTSPLPPPTLGQVVAFYKYVTTKKINEHLHTPGEKFWQRNYFERIIRNEREFEATYQYIYANPSNWTKDEYHHR